MILPGGEQMERIVERGLLYDFYGELLTEHQRRIYEDAVFNDLSPSEIAAEQGISRQGVHDLIRRCDRILEDYEAKLHLVAKFLAIRDMAREVGRLAGECLATGDMALVEEIRRKSEQISGAL